MILPSIESPADLRGLSYEELDQLAEEIRAFIIETVTTTGGHLGSNLGVVELTLALHRVFDSPRDVLLFDTGHQSYVHKLLTGRRYGFARLRQRGGLSGYPSRSESPHDWIESSRTRRPRSRTPTGSRSPSSAAASWSATAARATSSRSSATAR